jgi:hypothetical protein
MMLFRHLHPTRLGAFCGAVIAALALSAGIAFALGTAGAPQNTSLPSVSGSAHDGSTLTAAHGSWSNAPKSFAYSWESCDSQGGNCVAISGGNTSRQYTVTTADVGHRLRVVVTATNASGSASATSRTTGTVTATGTAPVNTSPPSISGTPKENQVLTVAPGNWTGSPAPTFTYQWQRCATAGACADIAGAAATTYTAGSVDVGNTLLVKVTATNSKGATLATSPETTLIAPATVGGKAISVTQVSLPNLLTIDNLHFTPNPLRTRGAFTARFHVSDTRGSSIQGALVYAIGLPYSWLGNAPEAVTDASGWATITFHPTAAMPLSRGGALVLFVRARKPGDNLLTGVSTRRLVQVRISG